MSTQLALPRGRSSRRGHGSERERPQTAADSPPDPIDVARAAPPPLVAPPDDTFAAALIAVRLGGAPAAPAQNRVARPWSPPPSGLKLTDRLA